MTCTTTTNAAAVAVAAASIPIPGYRPTTDRVRKISKLYHILRARWLTTCVASSSPAEPSYHSAIIIIILCDVWLHGKSVSNNHRWRETPRGSIPVSLSVKTRARFELIRRASSLYFIPPTFVHRFLYQEIIRSHSPSNPPAVFRSKVTSSLSLCPYGLSPNHLYNHQQHTITTVQPIYGILLRKNCVCSIRYNNIRTARNSTETTRINNNVILIIK